MNILFIDDDNEDYEMFCEACQALNSQIECIFRHNGAEGLRYLQETKELPDYIFLDINMPIMGGVECLRGIRTIERLKNTPVFIFSTAVNPGTDYKALGANQVLTKPIRYEYLIQLLRSVLKQGGD